MSDKEITKSGNFRSKSGGRMNTVLNARTWAEAIQSHHFRGMGDTRDAARFRAARATGIPESWFKRLTYRASEMKDVPATIYLELQAAYVRSCERIEANTEHQRQVRRTLTHGDTNDERSSGEPLGALSNRAREAGRAQETQN